MEQKNSDKQHEAEYDGDFSIPEFPPAYTSGANGSPSHTQVTDNKANINAGPSSQSPLKSFTIRATGIVRQRSLELSETSDPSQTPFLWIKIGRRAFTRSSVDIYANPAHTGPLLASAQVTVMGNSVYFYVGDGRGLNPDTDWSYAEHQGWTMRAYNFEAGGRKFQWRRTRNGDLGVTEKFSDRNYKLVELGGEGKAEERVVAVLIWRQNMFKGRLRELSRLDWYQDMGQDVELAALVVIVGVEEKITEWANAS